MEYDYYASCTILGEFWKMDCENESSRLYFQKNQSIIPSVCNTPLIVNCCISGKEKEEIRQACGAAVWRPVVM